MDTSRAPTLAPDQDRTVWRRLAFFAGLLVTLALIGLGAFWPSLFSLFALIVLPAPIIFLVGVFKPRVISDRPKLRVYLWICVALSVASWVAEIAWLATTYER